MATLLRTLRTRVGIEPQYW